MTVQKFVCPTTQDLGDGTPQEGVSVIEWDPEGDADPECRFINLNETGALEEIKDASPFMELLMVVQDPTALVNHFYNKQVLEVAITGIGGGDLEILITKKRVQSN